MRVSPIWIVGVVALLVPTAGMSQQERSAQPKPTERFSGKARLLTPRAREVSIAIHNWIIDERSRIEALELPVRGLVIVHLRGGSLTTVIGGKRQQRRADEFWTVPAGARMGIETGNDSAILQTIVVAE